MRITTTTVAFAVLAAALKALADLAPPMLPAPWGDLIAVAAAAAVGYLVPSPIQGRKPQGAARTR
jgi:hypothetical protein